MDNYPEEFAPEFEGSGAVKTPFDEWWARVAGNFPTVPENVARYWLHEHWSHSPYAFLQSANYTFRLADLPTDNLWQIHSRWDDFSFDNRGCLDHGQHLIHQHRTRPPEVYFHKTAAYMVENRDFPAPIIVLDNRDGHLKAGQGVVPTYEALPPSYILIEGHRRFNMALCLQREGSLNPTCKVWLMEHVQG